jgi:pilus assembly protein Flp/PilA
MREVLTLLTRLKSDEDGAALLEYTVLLVIILVAVLGVIAAVGAWINTKWTALNSQLSSY